MKMQRHMDIQLKNFFMPRQQDVSLFIGEIRMWKQILIWKDVLMQGNVRVKQILLN